MDRLYRKTDPSSLQFTTTAELEPVWSAMTAMRGETTIVGRSRIIAGTW
jgi:hypothetical protein